MKSLSLDAAPSTILEDDVRRLASRGAIESALLGAMDAADLSIPEIALQFGCITTTVLGGAQPDVLRAVLAKLPHGIRCAGGQVWVDYEGPQGPARWVFDAISSSLVLRGLGAVDRGQERAPAILVSSTRPRLIELARGIAEAANLAGSDCPLERLSDYSDAWAWYALPGHLAGLATCSYSYVPLREAAIVRASGYALRVGPSSPHGPGRARSSAVDTDAAYKQLRAALSRAQASDRKGGSPRGGRRRRSALLEEQILEVAGQASPGSVVHLGITWLLKLLRKGGARKKQLAMSTIETYLGAFSKLASALDGWAPSEISSEELETVIRGIVQDETPKSRDRTIRGLRELHAIGMAELGLEDVDWHAILSGTAGLVEKDPKNIVHEHELQLSLAFLDGLDAPEDYRLAARYCILVMARGGLRFGEAFRLRFRDVSIDGLLVRNTTHGKPKTDAGQRLVPSEAWACPALDEAIRSMKHRVQLLGGDSSAPLCCMADSPASLMSRSLLEALVATALRAATGDPSSRAHDLRHTALTRFAGMLVWSGVETDHWRDGVSLRKRMLGDSSASRRGIQALALLAGHADPDTTLETYVRGLEFRLAEAVDAVLPRLPLRLVQRLSGLTEAQVRKRSASGTAQPLILREAISVRASSDPLLDPARYHTTGQAEAPQLHAARAGHSLPLPRMRRLLFQAHKHGLDKDSLAVVHGIDAGLAGRYIQESERLSGEASIAVGVSSHPSADHVSFPPGNRRIGLDPALDLVSKLPWEAQLANASLTLCQSYVASSACLSLSHLAELLAILLFLKQLGVPMGAVSITVPGEVGSAREAVVAVDAAFSTLTFKPSAHNPTPRGRRGTRRRFRLRVDSRDDRCLALKNIVEAVCLWRIKCMAET